MSRIELTEYITENNTNLLKNGKIDGKHKNRLFESMSEKMSVDTANSIFSNAYRILNYLADPNAITQTLSKVLCLGKVQSGKTVFFISSIALSFDNGYDITYLIGGTKTTLKNQNLERVVNEFSSDSDIVLFDIKKTSIEEVEDALHNHKKVILVVLKNSAKKTNLGKMKEFCEYFTHYPSLIIDDEGDEVTPGAPKKKEKVGHGGRVHDYLENILDKVRVCTYLSVTATPQANLLLSTWDSISPDYCVLVKPGNGYTGGDAFHDVYQNHHTIEISDTEDFEASIPDSFKQALLFFIFACCIKKSTGDNHHYSMLVHPSSLTAIQTVVKYKINSYIYSVIEILSSSANISYEPTIAELFKHYNNYLNEYPNEKLDFKSVISSLPDVISNIKVYEFNSVYGREDIKQSAEDTDSYKIFIGGNMLSRGLTIDRLIVSYVYRDSELTSIDTLYQRARWFGYKASYFDVCRVYMTKELKEKFIATVENENDMWNALAAFLLNNVKIKEFPRLFTLNNEKLILTRPSVSKTVEVKRVNPGYTYEKSVLFDDDIVARQHNREVYETFYTKWASCGTDIKYSKNNTQIHKVIDMKFSDFYSDFIERLEFQTNSRYGHQTFKTILDKINENEQEDMISVVLMRYQNHEFRSLDSSGISIKELPQGRDDGNGYVGDKSLPDLMEKLHIQIHLVYHNEGEKEDYLPMLALNNPITKLNVRYVTGDNDYA